MTPLEDVRWHDGSAALEATDQLPGGTAGIWLALPPRGLPRVLIPRSEVGTIAPAVSSLVSHRSTGRRFLVAGGVGALRVGGAGLVPTNERWSIAAGRLLRLAREVSGLPDAIGVVRLNPHRPNRKPVLQLIDPATGATHAFVKVGWDALSAPLILHEMRTLRELEPPPGLTVPSIMGVAEAPVPAIAVTPLPGHSGTSNRVGAHELAARSVALFGPDGIGGVGDLRPLREVALVAELPARIDALGASPHRAAVAAALDRLLERDAEVPTRPGRWHGDWSSGNVVVTERSVVAWDWERSHPQAPVGLDAAYALLAGHTPRQALVPLISMLGESVAPRSPASLLRLALLVTALRHAEASAAGVTTRAEAAVGRLEEAMHL